MADAVVGPASLVLVASVARRFYLEGRSKVEIAEEFGLSRFKVARMLETARETGIVRIEIDVRGAVDPDLSARLRDRFGLRHAIVVDTGEHTDDVALRSGLGRVAAQLLAELTGPRDVLGVAWARSVGAMARSLPRLASVPVVQLTGALLPAAARTGRPLTDHSDPDQDSTIDIVRDVARSAGGPAYVFHVPLVLPDAATARAMRGQPEVARAFDLLPRVTRAVVGVGDWAPGQSMLHDCVGDRERRALHRLGVCAEVSAVLLDAAGTPIRTRFTERIIAPDAGQLRAIGEVIAICYGAGKVRAVTAALRSGLLNGIVTHRALAEALLDQR